MELGIVELPPDRMAIRLTSFRNRQFVQGSSVNERFRKGVEEEDLPLRIMFCRSFRERRSASRIGCGDHVENDSVALHRIW